MKKQENPFAATLRILSLPAIALKGHYSPTQLSALRRAKLTTNLDKIMGVLGMELVQIDAFTFRFEQTGDPKVNIEKRKKKQKGGEQ